MRMPGTSTSTHPRRTARKCRDDDENFAAVGYVIAILYRTGCARSAVAVYFGLAVYLVLPLRISHSRRSSVRRSRW